MNKKILCIIPFSLLTMACSHQELVAIPGCVHRPVDPHKQCVNNRGNSKTPFIVVTPNGWVIKPNNVCVEEGDTLEIQFKGPAPKLNAMKTIPHGNSEFWMIGSNSSVSTTISLKVGARPAGTDHLDFAIFSQAHGCMDPRVTYK